MSVALSLEWLESHWDRPLKDLNPFDAFRLADNFLGLEWWLRDEVLEMALEHPLAKTSSYSAPRWRNPFPSLSERLGSCVAVTVLDDGQANRCRFLRDALLVPLQWVESTLDEPVHDVRLPVDLLRMADEIAEAFRDPNARKRRWRLQPGAVPGLERFDFSRLPIRWESAWAALAAARLVAIRGGDVRRDVWASARQPGGDSSRIDGIDCKLELACRWGVSQFFLPHDQVDEAKQFLSLTGRTHPTIKALPMNKYHLEEALRPLVDALGIPPGRTDEPENPSRRAAWYLELADGNRANQYHYDAIFDDVVRRCRDQLGREFPDWHPSRMVVILSKSLASLVSAAVINPQACQVLYTKDDQEIAAVLPRLKQWFNEKLPGTRVRFNGFDRNRGRDLDQIIEAMTRPFVRRVPPEHVVYDVTSGYSVIKMTLATRAPAGSSLIVIDSKWRQGRRNEPFTENIERIVVQPEPARRVPQNRPIPQRRAGSPCKTPDGFEKSRDALLSQVSTPAAHESSQERPPL